MNWTQLKLKNIAESLKSLSPIDFLSKITNNTINCTREIFFLNVCNGNVRGVMVANIKIKWRCTNAIIIEAGKFIFLIYHFHERNISYYLLCKNFSERRRLRKGEVFQVGVSANHNDGLDNNTSNKSDWIDGWIWRTKMQQRNSSNPKLQSEAHKLNSNNNSLSLNSVNQYHKNDIRTSRRISDVREITDHCTQPYEGSKSDSKIEASRSNKYES
ncbi:uncharacterized protein [Prorops nasuta]|uniref:uncharacterized protein n=1 Tax=Prorops nasuta TaxID=863751 RepID=UPI0034CFDF41